MLKTSRDQKRTPVRTFQTQLPVWVNFCASARYASLRRRACSARLRSVMSSDSAIMNCGTLSVPGTRETLLLLRVAHHRLEDVIGGQKAAVQVSQRNPDSRILKDGSPPLLAFPKGFVGTLPLLQIGIGSVPLRDFSRSIAQRTTAKQKPAKFAVEAAEAALHFERLSRIQSFLQCFQNSWQVVWMNRNLPPRAQSLRCR